jgi:hypothetical protein
MGGVLTGELLHIPINRGGQADHALQAVLPVGDRRKVLPGIGIRSGLEESPLDILDRPMAFRVVLCRDIGEAELC